MKSDAYNAFTITNTNSTFASAADYNEAVDIINQKLTDAGYSESMEKML